MGKNTSGSFYVLRLAWEMGYIIAIPLVLFLLFGIFLDRTYETTPFFMIFAIILSIFVSSYGIYRMVLPALEGAQEQMEKTKAKGKK